MPYPRTLAHEGDEVGGAGFLRILDDLRDQTGDWFVGDRGEISLPDHLPFLAFDDLPPSQPEEIEVLPMNRLPQIIHPPPGTGEGICQFGRGVRVPRPNPHEMGSRGSHPGADHRCLTRIRPDQDSRWLGHEDSVEEK